MPSPIEKFPRVSLFLLTLLTLCTMGLYVPYWLYTRTRLLNLLCPEHPIAAWFVALCMGGYIMLIFLILQLPEGTTATKLMASPEFTPVINVAAVLNVFMLVWSVFFLQRINRLTAAQPGDALYGNYFTLILSHIAVVNIFYLQYKINQIIDQSQPTIGIM